MAGYIGREPTYGSFDKQKLTPNSITSQFTLNYPVANSGSLVVVKDGSVLEPNVDYSSAYNIITFASVPLSTSKLWVIFLGRQILVPTADGKQITVDSFTGNGTITDFALAQVPAYSASVQVFVDGVLKVEGVGKDYNVVGQNISFTVAPSNLAVIKVYSLGSEKVDVSVLADNSIASSKLAYNLRQKIGDWSIITGATNAALGTWYMVDTTSAGVTVTLPPSPVLGDTFKFKDLSGTFATNNLTINPNGKNIIGSGSNKVYNTNNQAITLVYSNTTRGWIET